MKPTARRVNIFREDLPTEVILYDKTSQQVHCLNKTVAIVWENADGTRSIDSLSGLLEEKLGVSDGRDLVLSSLDQLSKVGLLEAKIETDSEEVVSRRAIGKRLVMAGVSAAMFPVLASLAVPAAAQSGSPSLTVKLEGDQAAVLQEISATPGLSIDSAGNCSVVKNGGATQLQKTACTDYNSGISKEEAYTMTPTTQIYNAGINDFQTAASDLGGFVPYVH